MLEPGTVVAGYRVERPLGRGGMGVVYEATQLSLGRRVALKLLEDGLGDDETRRARFRREAQFQAALEHAHVVVVHETGEAPEGLFIAMRLVRGGTLRDLIAGHALDDVGIMAILSDVAGALDAAHGIGLIHRDVKPENILIGPDGHAFLADFGLTLAQDGGGLTTTGRVMGTVAYLAPERASGREVTGACDVYSLAAVLFECLTASVPFPRGSDIGVVFAHLDDPVPSVRERRPDLPPELDAVIARGMAKAPDARFSLASGLMDAAQAVLTGRTAGSNHGRTVPAPSVRERPRDARAPASSLPRPLTSLVGRAGELEGILALLEHPESDLVTLTGPGGTGKTRLAIESAERWDAAGRPVAFVALAPLVDAGQVPTAVATALGLTVAGGGQVIDAVADALTDRRGTLLVLDNFEHVVAAAGFVGELLVRVETLTVLVTSRMPLRLYGEREYTVPPLGLPAPGTEEDSPAIELLVRRVRDIRPDFALDDGNAAALAAICRRLDGLPLAIELAARRFRVLQADAILQRLEKSLDLLTGGPRDQPDRQQTLRRTIDWSFGLLSADEQRLLCELAVFAGGASLEAVESVCGSDLDALTVLVESSLVRFEHARGGDRLGMLQTIREYALDKLSEDAGPDAATRARHARYFLALAENAHEGCLGSEQQHWLDLLERELDNCRAALTWAVEVGDAETAVGVAGALGEFWDKRGRGAEGRMWLRTALSAADGVSPARRARGLLYAGLLAIVMGDDAEGLAFRAEAASLFESLRDVRGQVEALTLWPSAVSDPAAARSVDRALALARTHGDPSILAMALSNAAACLAPDQAERALTLLREALVIGRSLGNPALVALIAGNSAEFALLMGDERSAAAHVAEALPLAREIEYREIVAGCTGLAGIMSLDGGDITEAALRFAETLQNGRQAGIRPSVVEALLGLAGVAAARGKDADAVHLWEAANAIGMPLVHAYALVQRRHIEPVRERIPPHRLESLVREGRALTREQAIDLALAIAADAGA